MATAGATLADVVLVVDVVVGAGVGDKLAVVVLAVAAVGVVGCVGVWECRMVLAHNRS
jgi:hypothetical protein